MKSVSTVDADDDDHDHDNVNEYRVIGMRICVPESQKATKPISIWWAFRSACQSIKSICSRDIGFLINPDSLNKINKHEKKNQLNIALNYRLCMCEYWNQFNKHISVLLCHSNRRIFCRRIELKALRIPLHMTKRTEMTSFAQAFKGCIVMFNVIIRRIERERIEIVGCHYVSGLAK